MAPLPTITNAYRVEMVWSGSGGVVPVNVFHLNTDAASEAEVGANLVTAFEDAESADFAKLVQVGQELRGFNVTALDGTSASFFVSVSGIGGSATGQPITNMACILSFRTAQRGPRGRGRLFLGPITEDGWDGGNLTSADLADMVTAWSNIATLLGTSSPSTALAVASYVHEDINNVTGIEAKNVPGTQRRRLDQLR